MRKGYIGAAKIGLSVIFLVSFSIFASLYIESAISATPNGTVIFTQPRYYPDSVAVIEYNNTEDSTSTVDIIVNSSKCPGSTTITYLTKQNNNFYNGTITFSVGGSCSGSLPLGVNRNDVVEVYLNERLYISNQTEFNQTVNGTVYFNDTVYGCSETPLIIIRDNDTSLNILDWDEKNVTINSSSGDGSIYVTLNETGIDTGIFNGTFSFNCTGVAGNDTTDMLGVSQGDNITVRYNDTTNTGGNVLIMLNTSKMSMTSYVVFDKTAFYPSDTGRINITDYDLNTNSSTQQSVNVTINSTTGGSIVVNLTEVGTDTGLFTGTFTFNLSNGSSNITNNLGVKNTTYGVTEVLNAWYSDSKNFTGTSVVITNTSGYTYKSTASIQFDSSTYGPSNNATITLTDYDMNSIAATPQHIQTLLINSTNDTAGVVITIDETGTDTGIFNVSVAFNISGTSKNDSAPYYIAVNDGDIINVIYTDTNSSGSSATVIANSSFYNSVSAVLDINGTNLNSTYKVVVPNQTIKINVSDSDSYANINSSLSENITVNVSFSSCIIQVTLNETGEDTGLFEGTINFTTTAGLCSDADNTLYVTSGDHSVVTVTYNDTKNTSAENAITRYQFLVDNKNPVASAIAVLDPDNVYYAGDNITLNLTLDQIGGNISANFSQVDDGYGYRDDSVTDNGDLTYTIFYGINTSTTQSDGIKTINVTIYDRAGNGPTYTSINVRLTRVVINETLINFTTTSPGGTAYKWVVVENNGSANQTSFSEIIDIYKENNFQYYTTLNETRTFYFMITNISTNISWSITSNSSSIGVSPALYSDTMSLVSTSTSGLGALSGFNGLKVYTLKVTTSNVTSGVLVTPVVNVYFNSSYYLSSNFTGSTYFENGSNKTIKYTLAIPSENTLSSTFNGTVYYSNTNTSVASNLTFNVSSAQEWIGGNTSSPSKNLPTGTLTYNINLGRDIGIWEVYVNNTGNINLTNVEANLTSVNFTCSSCSGNTAIEAGVSAKSGEGLSISNKNNMTFGSIEPDSSKRIYLTFNTSNHTEGVYTSYIIIKSLNGQPYNYSNITLNINVTSYLNVTINSATYNGTHPDPHPGKNVTIDFTVTYMDGTPLTSLTRYNLSVYDMTNTSVTYSMYTTTPHVSNGRYVFNITVPGMDGGNSQPGIHSIYVEAREPSGSNKANASTYYNLSAPRLGASISTDDTLNINTYRNLSIILSNTGTAPINNVYLRITSNDSGLLVTTNNCTITTINASSSTTSCYITIKGVTLGHSGLLSIASFGGHDSLNNEYNSSAWTTVVQVINSSESSSETTTTETSSSTSSSNTASSTTVTKELSISDYDEGLTVEQGSSVETSVVVGNTGQDSIKTKLNVSIDSSISFSISPASITLGGGDTGTFKVTLSASNTTKIGRHKGMLDSYDDADETIRGLAIFYLTVTPNEEGKKSINESYINYTDIVSGLLVEFERLKSLGAISGNNATEVELLLNNSLDLLEEIKLSMDGGDYTTAATKMEELNININRVKDALNIAVQEEEKQKQLAGAGIWMWAVIIVIVVVVVALFIYMFLPSKRRGFSATSGMRYKSLSADNPIARLKRSIRMPHTLKKASDAPKTSESRVSSYIEGYEKKHSIYDSGEGRGLGSKMKGIFKKKKQRSLSSFLADKGRN